MVSILISILILAVIAYVVYLLLAWVLGLAPIPAPIVTIVWIIFAVVVIAQLLNIVGFGGHLLK
jgi:hypothetical protein